MLIHANLCKYHRQTDGETDKHIKSIVRYLTKLMKIFDSDYLTENTSRKITPQK